MSTHRPPPNYLVWFKLAAGEWLYQFEPSQLCEEVLTLLDAAEQKLAQNWLPKEPDPIEACLALLPAFYLTKRQRGEVCVKTACLRVRVAVGEFPSIPPDGYSCEHGYELAEVDLIDAGCYFSDSPHREATVRWMVGSLRLMRGKIDQGFLNLGESIRLYEQTLLTRRANLNSGAAHWYTNHIAELQQLQKEVKKTIVA